jgi:hypothetical protein
VTEEDLRGKNASFMDAAIFAQLCGEHSVVPF